MPRANIALKNGFSGTRIGYRTTPAPEPHYFPSKGAHFAKHLIRRHPQAMLHAYKRASEWLDTHGPRTAEPASFTFMAEFWRVLNEHIAPRGEMALYLRHNH